MPRFKSGILNSTWCRSKRVFIGFRSPLSSTLLGDSGPFVLPNSVIGEDALPNRVCNPRDEDDLVVPEGSGDESWEFPPPSFPELEFEVKESIESLGAVVVPKLNWSSPKDAAWISSSGNLRCTSLSESALLLRASNSLTHDLCLAYDSCSDKTSSRPQSFFLALRKWQPALRSEMEFRCFIRNKLLVGICQREVTTFYPVLLEKKSHLKVLIEDFYESVVCPNFELDNYTFDVYISKDGRVKVLDFNPWGAFTLPLLFSWDELSKGDDEGVDFRIVESRRTVRPSLKTALPYDYLDPSPGIDWDQFLRNADEEQRRQTKESPKADA